VALALGVVLQTALAFAPDPGLGPGPNGLADIHPGLGSVSSLFLHNMVAVAVIGIGGVLTGWVVLSGNSPRPRRRMLAYLCLIAIGAWTYFVSGVGWLAADLDVSRPALALRLVHGYLEWPALLLPWAAVAFAVGPRRSFDGKLVLAACACSVLLLAGAATLEALVVPDLLGASA
jgi:hypothetical protein